MKKVYWHFRENWSIYFVALGIIIVIIIWPVRKYMDAYFTKDIVCTVENVEVKSHSGGSGAIRTSSSLLSIETRECGLLHANKSFIKGVALEDMGKLMDPGSEYIFTVNRYELLSGYGVVSNIRNSSGEVLKTSSR